MPLVLKMATPQQRSWYALQLSKKESVTALQHASNTKFYIVWNYLYPAEARNSSTASEFITLLMEALRTSEISVYFNETTRRYIVEGLRLSSSFKLPLLWFDSRDNDSDISEL
jgi:hypothetical protein